MNNQGTIQILDRDIYLYGDIDDSMALEVVSRINHINEVDDIEEQALIDDIGSKIADGLLDEDALNGVRAREPINIEINSNGGSSPAGFSIITAIRNSETPTIGYVTGNCMSMAIPILASCDFKIGSEYSKFMIHDVYSASEGKFNDLNSSLEYISSVREDYIRATAQNTRMTEDDVREITNRNSDYFFSPEKAFELGLIDLIDNHKVDEEEMLRKLYGPKEDSGDEDDSAKKDKGASKELEHLAVGLVENQEEDNDDKSDRTIPSSAEAHITVDLSEIDKSDLYISDDNSVKFQAEDSGLLSRIAHAINYIIKG